MGRGEQGNICHMYLENKIIINKAQRTEKLGRDGERADAETTKGSSGGDVLAEDSLSRLLVVTMPNKDHALVLELLGNLLH